MIKSLFASNATFDSYPRNKSMTHACPDCRCSTKRIIYPFSPDRHLSNFNQIHFRQTTQQSTPNIYLQKHSSQRSIQSKPFNPYRSSIFDNKIKFNYSPKISPKQSLIVFNYISPSKVGKAVSMDNKFSARRYQTINFPPANIKASYIHGQNEKSIKNINYYQTSTKQIYTKQKTPQKHKILQLKTKKSKHKIDITLKTSRSSKKDIQGQYVTTSKKVIKKESALDNEYQFETPKKIKDKELQKSIKEIQSSQLKVERYPINQIYQSSISKSMVDKQKQTIQSNKRTIQDKTSNKSEYSKMSNYVDYEIAKSLNKDLMLHYDYSNPQGQKLSNSTN